MVSTVLLAVSVDLAASTVGLMRPEATPVMKMIPIYGRPEIIFATAIIGKHVQCWIIWGCRSAMQSGIITVPLHIPGWAITWLPWSMPRRHPLWNRVIWSIVSLWSVLKAAAVGISSDRLLTDSQLPAEMIFV